MLTERFRSAPRRALELAILALLSSAAGLGVQERGAPDRTIDAAMRKEVIEGVLKHVRENYPYPEAVTAMERTLRERLAKGEYEAVTSGAELAKLLTAHLQAVREDPHLRVEFTADPGASDSPTATTGRSAEEERRQQEHWQRYGAARNYFVDRAERLAGNVGYLRLSAFFFVDMTKETLAAAMTLVAHTDALVVDLRHCGGGDVATTELFEHYFFADAADPNLAAPRYLDRSVFLLTSREIYSAPEAVARSLQTRGRAVVVGEATRGATNVTAGHAINRYFSVSVPYTRSTDAAGADRSRMPVEPDIAVAAERALDEAYLAALEELAPPRDDPELLQERAQASAALRQRLGKAQPDGR